MKQCSVHRSLSDDFDKINPCFFESDMDEEFYDSPAPGPSQDIWKKFELLPTPPRSPQHEANYSTLPPSLDKLVSEILEEPFDTDFSMFPEDCAMCNTEPTCPSPTQKNESNLKSNLIQDCMWSGLNIAQDLKLLAKPEDSEKSQNGITLTPTTPVKSSANTLSISSTMDINSNTECVDPTAVFPYPLSETRDNLGAETPSDSEDEEIDVVTVNDKVQITRRKPIMPAASSMQAQVAAMHNYTTRTPPHKPPEPSPTRFTLSSHSPRRSPMVSHKRSRSSHGSSNHHPPIKRIRISLPRSELSSVVHKLGKYNRHGGHSSGGSSRSSSDSEDSEGCRRSQHNILERKRRNDLKSSFLTLRDHIPELAPQDKAPKVVILKKATDYVLRLRRNEKAYTSELEQLRQRRDQLKRRLQALQRL